MAGCRALPETIKGCRARSFGFPAQLSQLAAEAGADSGKFLYYRTSFLENLQFCVLTLAPVNVLRKRFTDPRHEPLAC
jgi:hypothetical protein